MTSRICSSFFFFPFLFRTSYSPEWVHVQVEVKKSITIPTTSIVYFQFVTTMTPTDLTVIQLIWIEYTIKQHADMMLLYLRNDNCNVPYTREGMILIFFWYFFNNNSCVIADIVLKDWIDLSCLYWYSIIQLYINTHTVSWFDCEYTCKRKSFIWS